MSTTIRTANPTSASRKLNVTLWVIQFILAAVFLFAGGMKLVMPIAAMTAQIPVPGWFVRFIGVAEFFGGLGLVLPSLLRIRPELTPLAARGLVIIMSGAVGVTLTMGQRGPAFIPLVVGVLAGVVSYGRTSWAPLAPRAARSGVRHPSLVASRI